MVTSSLKHRRKNQDVIVPGHPHVIALAMESQMFLPLLLRAKLLPSGKGYFCVIKDSSGSFSVWVVGERTTASHGLQLQHQVFTKTGISFYSCLYYKRQKKYPDTVYFHSNFMTLPLRLRVEIFNCGITGLLKPFPMPVAKASLNKLCLEVQHKWAKICVNTTWIYLTGQPSLRPIPSVHHPRLPPSLVMKLPRQFWRSLPLHASGGWWKTLSFSLCNYQLSAWLSKCFDSCSWTQQILLVVTV